MARFFDIDDANAALPEVRTILEGLRDQVLERQEAVEAGGVRAAEGSADSDEAASDAELRLIRLRDVVLERQEAVEAGAGRAGDAPLDAEAEAELKLIRLRMQGVIDQMQAGVARIDAQGITLREIETGLIDFPALVSGRQVCLCWRLGEDDVEWWHEMTAGFTGRKPLIDLA